MIRIAPQFAVFMDNRPGMLARLCQTLTKAQVNIEALSILDTVDHAIIRMVVNKPQEAEQVLKAMDATVQRRDVIVMDVPNRVGALSDVAEKLAKGGINLEYAYCTASTAHSEGAIVLRTNDLEATINALS